jgi:isopentenyl-diphosphate Delta-isomerase
MPPKVAPIEERKADHIKINLEQNVESGLTSGLERYRFIHQALPELNLSEIETTLSLFGKQLAVPLLISSMTGGATEAGPINRTLAEAAQACNIAMGVGSQRAALEHPEQAESFRIVRQTAPNILLFANIGAVQLNYGYGVDECRRAVDMIEADGLYLHLNAVQEAVQPEGDGDFSNLAAKIEQICTKLEVPVIAKEVGWGISSEAALTLWRCGISAIDVAGAGGTSWSQVEMYRATTESQRQVAAAFIDWGIPTAESIINAYNIMPDLPIFASGGLKNGMDIAKSIALGATLGGMAGPFLKTAAISTEKTIELIETTRKIIAVAMFASGAKTLQDLDHSKLQSL